MNDLEDEAVKRTGEAQIDKDLHLPWIRDLYRFTMPWRRRPGEQQQTNDQDELFDQTAQEALADFAGDMQDNLTPIDDDWIALEPAPGMSAADAAQLAPLLQGVQTAVFSEIRRSNLYEATLEAYPDLAIGTASLCIQDLGVLTEPIHCLAVPLTDLLLTRGVYGGVDFRAREIPAMKRRDLAVNYPHAMTEDLLRSAEADPAGTVCVKECWWRLWDKPNYGERWQYVLLIDSQYAAAAEYEGDGSCSLIAARWKTDSTTAWGIGSLYTALPGIKTLDELSYLVLKQLSFAVDPARTYDNDGTINPENGVDPGTWLPRMPGSKIDTLGSDADFDTTFFSREDMQKGVKRALFQDGPVQTGDTPPTAFQWADQKAAKAKRMGAPFGRMKTEWQMAIFVRFVYLLQNRGVIPKGFNLRSPKIRVVPQSPLILASQQHKAATASQMLQGLGAMFGPQALSVLVKAPETAAAIQKALGDKLVQLNSPAEVQTMMQQAAQAAQAAAQPPQPSQPPPFQLPPAQGSGT